MEFQTKSNTRFRREWIRSFIVGLPAKCRRMERRRSHNPRLCTIEHFEASLAALEHLPAGMSPIQPFES
jgi:hypothetical protein